MSRRSCAIRCAQDCCVGARSGFQGSVLPVNGALLRRRT
jgi:hypothetical protein